MLLDVKFNSHDIARYTKIDVIATAITWRTTTREMIDLNRITHLLADEISDATYGMDLYPGAFVRELLS
jgi:hypothetical protein